MATCRGIATIADVKPSKHSIMDISIILIIVGVLGFFYARGCRQEKEREEKKHSRIRTHEEWQKYLEEEQRELDKLSRN